MNDQVSPPTPGPGNSAELRIQIAEVDGVTVVFVGGDLDIVAIAQMSEALKTGCLLARDRLVVDVSGSAFMDLGGLRVLASAHNRLLRLGRPGIVVRGASGIVRRVFELAGFTSLLDASLVPAQRYSPRAWGSGRELEDGRRHAGLPVESLFAAYFALGGTASFAAMVTHLRGAADVLDAHQRDVAAHALNEHLADLGCTEHLLSYVADQRR